MQRVISREYDDWSGWFIWVALEIRGARLEMDQFKFHRMNKVLRAITRLFLAAGRVNQKILARDRWINYRFYRNVVYQDWNVNIS